MFWHSAHPELKDYGRELERLEFLCMFNHMPDHMPDCMHSCVSMACLSGVSVPHVCTACLCNMSFHMSNHMSSHQPTDVS